MRSLWRILASRWLGGEGSEALTTPSTVLESLLFADQSRRVSAFEVRRDPGVSHHAMMSPSSERRLHPEIASGHVLRSGSSRRRDC